MRRHVMVWSVVVGLAIAAIASAQAPPRLVRFAGAVKAAEGVLPAGAATVTFAVYADAEGGAPLWSETQGVLVDADGRYTAVLGVTLPEGVPLDIFASGMARWLGVSGEGLATPARVMLVSVPYALKAADADTVGGKPLSALVLAGETPGVGTDGLTYVNTQVLKNGLAGATAATAGTAGRVAMFTDTTNVGDSLLFQNTGTSRIGLGTTSPLALLHVTSGTAPAAFFDVYSNVLTALPVIYRAARGTPSVPTAVQVNDILGGLAVRGYGATNFSGGGRGQVAFMAAENWNDGAQGTYLSIKTSALGTAGAPVERLRVAADGKVGVGTTAPTAMLHVAGDAVVDGNIGAKYQDVAEWVESGEKLAPGTVVVVDAGMANGVRPATAAYDAKVAGAVSAQPGVILGEKGATKSLVAQSGRVKVKVDARYGAVKAGDLLVTSPTPGYAMVSKPVKMKGLDLHRPGTILGKALEPLAAGQGEVLVLLTLQ